MLGGGKFICADGSLQDVVPSYKNITIPAELLPSSQDLERNLESVVISDSKL